MNWFGLRWPVVVLAFAGSLLAIWGGQQLVSRYGYQQPLREAVAADQAVVSYSVSHQNGVTVYRVRFQPGGDLETQWQDFHKIIAAHASAGSYRIEPVDNPDAKLNQVYYNSQYAVYEALARGTFQAMDGQVMGQARAAGVTARVWVDDRNVYLALADGTHTLQKVFARPVATPAAGAANG